MSMGEAAAERVGRHLHPRWAWVIAIATLVLGPLALRLAFTAGDTGGGGQSPLAFALSSLLLGAIWALGGLGVIAAHGPDRAVRHVARGRAALLAMIVGAVFAACCLLGALTLLALPWTHAWVSDALLTAQAAAPLVVLLVALLAGAGEEVFFRLALTRLMRGWVRWIVPVALYAVATVATGNVGLVLVAIPLGLVATFVWDRTGRWTGPIIVHAIWSLVMVGLLPMLVG